MSTTQDSLGAAAVELGALLAPLAQELAPARVQGFFAQIGIPLDAARAAALAGPLGDTTDATGDLIAVTPQIIAALAAESWGTAVERALVATTHVGRVIAGLDSVATAAQGLAVPNATQIASRIFSFLLARYLDRKAPGANDALQFAGLLERNDFNVGSTDPANPPFSVYIYHLDAIGEWLGDPALKARTLYGWGSGFDGSQLFPLLARVLTAAGGPVVYDATSSPKRLDVLALELVPTTSGPAGVELRLRTTVSTGTQTFPLGDTTRLEVHAEFQPPPGTRLALLTDGTASFVPPAAASLSGRIAARLIVGRQAPPDPFIVFGVAGGSRLEFREFILAAGGGFQWSGGATRGDLDVSGAVNGGKVVIDATKGDGFLGKILPGTRVEADFEFAMGVSSERGFYFSGSSALEVRLPLHIELGPISIEGLTLSAALDGTHVPVSVGADIRALLGPIEAVVQNMGVTATLSFPPQNHGNLGPVQLDVGFKPPNGVGLQVSAGPVTGGGFLSLDYARGEYVGALELSFKGVFTLKAIGIINTKMPDGSKGFALLILVTAEFTPIQLGFGFTLLGVGGLLGLNRSLDREALKLGVRTGAVNSVLFPPDVIGNITRIVSDLKSFFPIVQGHFVVAPMGKLGWGTPTLISLEIGIILDIPSPQLTIIGVLRCILPAEDAPVLKLQVNFAGGIDFDEGLIWFDASLFDSSLLLFTLTGDMALRIGWGAQKLFVISVGGFHPSFREVPPDLTGMRRMSIALLSGDNPRLVAQTYFAVTSNTVQSGARVELYAAASGFNLYGFLGYDLLVQFSPFYFIAELYAGLALRRGSDVLFGIDVHCRLSGPQPWNAAGEASFKILFVRVSIGFDVTWGEDAPALPQDREDVLLLMEAAVRDGRNWEARMPANTSQTVTLRQVEPPGDAVLLHPFGMLSVSQKVAPLEFPIDRFGNKKPKGDTTFTLTWAGGGSETLREEFAVAHFVTLTDSEKLSRKSFEPLKAGLRFGTGDATSVGPRVEKVVSYELAYVHRKRMLTIRGGLIAMMRSVFGRLSGGGAISQNAHSVARRKGGGNGPAAVMVNAGDFLVVTMSDLTPASAGAAARTQAEAFALHDALVRSDPALAGTLQVVAAHELFTAGAA